MTNSGGAAALRGPIKVLFPPALSEPLIITTAGKQTVRIRPVGVYYYDAESGKSVLLGAVRDAEGELVPPNTVLYHSAVTDGLKCAIRYVYTHGAFESDLVIMTQPAKPPEAFGLNPATTRLELLHAIDGPPPRQTTHVIKGQTDPLLRAAMVSPDLTDTVIDYGTFWFPEGYAFSTLDGSEKQPAPGVAAQIRLADPSGPDRIRVGKQMLQLDADNVGLIESVDWSDIKPKLDALPPADRGARNTAPNRQASLKRELPVLKKPDKAAAPKMKLASSDYQPTGY